MPLGATENAILARMTGKTTVDDAYRGNWSRGFNSQNAHRHISTYNNLIAAIGHLKTGWNPTRRYAEDFAAIIDGDGKYNYALDAVNPNEGDTFDPNLSEEKVTAALFGKAPDDVRQAVINNLRNKYWKTTIHAHDLAAGGFEGLLGVAEKQIASLEASDNISEWELVWTMLKSAAKRNLGTDITAPAPTDAASTQDFVAALSTAVATATKPSTLYNPSGVKRAAKKENLVCIIRSSALARLRLAYQGAFNLAYAQPLEDSQFEEMPDALWDAGDEDIQYILIEKIPGSADSTVLVVDNWIQNHVEEIPTFGRANHLRTHNSVYGVNPFVTFAVGRVGAIANPGSTIPVPATMEFDIMLNGNPATEVRRGWDYPLAYEAKDAEGFGAGSAAITISGATSTHTYVDPTGEHLFVGGDEDAETLTITATSALDDAVVKTLTVPVTGVKIPLVPPYGDAGENPGGGGGTTINLTPTNVATISQNTVTPGNIIGDYSLVYEGTIDGVNVPTSPFTAPVTLTQAGDGMQVTAVPGPGVTLTGTTTRVHSFQAG